MISKTILAAVVACLAHNKEADAVFVTEDGSCFLPENKGAAFLHSRTKRLPEPKLYKRIAIEAIEEAHKRIEVRKGTPPPTAPPPAPPVDPSTDKVADQVIGRIVDAANNAKFIEDEPKASSTKAPTKRAPAKRAPAKKPAAKK